MDKFSFQVISAYSILLAVIAGLIRYRYVLVEYRLFIVFVCFAIANDLLSNVLIYYFKNNIMCSNIYVGIEYIILLLIFYAVNGWKKNSFYISIALFGGVVWIFDNLILNSIIHFNSIFRVFYSLVILLFSIDGINRILVYEKKKLFSSSKFIIFITFIIYYSYKAFIEVFYFARPELSKGFYSAIYMLMIYINFFTNLSYFAAILCMPTKRKFTLQY